MNKTIDASPWSEVSRAQSWVISFGLGFGLLVSPIHTPSAIAAQVPALLSFQGRVYVEEGVFDGTGYFKFSLINQNGTQVYWGNSPDGNFDGAPDVAVSIPVDNGLYSILLGDSSVPNMAPLPPDAFQSDEVYLRVWFHDGTHPAGFERLSPDHRVASVGYALMAAAVSDGAVQARHLADASITGAKLVPGAVGTSQLAEGSITSAKLAAGALQANALQGILVPGQLPASVSYLDDLTRASNSLAGLIATLTARVDSLSTGGSGLPSGVVTSSRRADDPSLLAAGYRPFSTLPAPSWQDGSSDLAPSGRIGHAGLWTGSQFLVWGGEVAAGVYSATGSAYDPSSDIWTPITPFQAPTARAGMASVWTGSELVLWGGFGTAGFLSDGSRFDPGSGAWRDVADSGAPEARDRHVGLWTSGGMLVWGGRNGSGVMATGALYQPGSDSWSALILPGAPEARMWATAVWTGRRALVWGGQGASANLNTGGQLLFDDFGGAFEWREIPVPGAPSPRRGHSAVWTGTTMVIWGGMDSAGVPLSDGAAFNPTTGSWTPLNTEGTPTARHDHTAVWTGSEMLIFGGTTADGPTATGAAYDPLTSSWRALSSAGGPAARSAAAGAWSGAELLVFGGLGSGGQRVGALQRLDPAPTWHLYRVP